MPLAARRALDRTRDYVYDTDTFNLARVRDTLRFFHDPLRKIKVVHVGGSKGKGSVCAMVTAGLVAAGQHVGTFTSPALFHDREMIAINNRVLSARAFSMLVRKYERKISASLTHFETMFVLACLAFRDMGVAYAVVEVGMGGRLDATNVVQPAVTVLCPIEKEHADLLGKTLTAITREKCGIIKPRVPLVVGAQKLSVLCVIRKIAGEMISATAHEPLPHTFGLLGAHQKDNARIAACVLECLGFSFPAKYRMPLYLPGRCTVLRKKPLLVLDAAHTVESARALRAFLDTLAPKAAWTFLFSVLADKPVQKILKVLVRGGDHLVLIQLDHPRAAQVGGIPLEKACEKVFALRTPVCVVGSFQLVREFYKKSARADFLDLFLA